MSVLSVEYKMKKRKWDCNMTLFEAWYIYVEKIIQCILNSSLRGFTPESSKATILLSLAIINPLLKYEIAKKTDKMLEHYFMFFPIYHHTYINCFFLGVDTHELAEYSAMKQISKCKAGSQSYYLITCETL